MKHFILLFLFITVGSIAADKPTDEYVFICTGNYSKCYHKTDKCEGLTYCSKEIKKVTIKEAKDLNRKACKYCYSK